MMAQPYPITMGYLPKTMYLRDDKYASEYRKSLQGVTKIVRVPQWEFTKAESLDVTAESPIHAMTFKGNVSVTSRLVLPAVRPEKHGHEDLHSFPDPHFPLILASGDPMR